MPNFNEFKVNNNLLDEIKRVKKNEVKQYVLPVKIPSSVNTIQPDEVLEITDWFDYLRTRKRLSKEIEENVCE